MNTAAPMTANKSSFSRMAANLSWICPITTVIIFALLIWARDILARETIAAIASSGLCLLVVGLIFGIVALFGISRRGRKGILVPAIVGIIVNGLLISFVIANAITSKSGAIHRHGGINASPAHSEKVIAPRTHCPRAWPSTEMLGRSGFCRTRDYSGLGS